MSISTEDINQDKYTAATTHSRYCEFPKQACTCGVHDNRNPRPLAALPSWERVNLGPRRPDADA